MTRRSTAVQKPASVENGGVDGHDSPHLTPARPTLHQRTSSLSSIQVTVSACEFCKPQIYAACAHKYTEQFNKF